MTDDQDLANLHEQLAELQAQHVELRDQALRTEAEVSKEQEEAYSASLRLEHLRSSERRLYDEAQARWDAFQSNLPRMEAIAKAEQQDVQEALNDHAEVTAKQAEVGVQIRVVEKQIAAVEARPGTDPLPPTRALDFAALDLMSFDELKELARRKLGKSGDIRQMQNGTIMLPALSEDLTLEDIDWRPSSRSAVNISRGGATGALGEPKNLGVHNVRLIPTEGSQPLVWFMRAYNIEDVSISNTNIHGMVTRHSNGTASFNPQEHGFYISRNGDLLVIHCLFEELGGHGLHLANRAYPFQIYQADNRPVSRKTHLRILHTGFVDTDQFARRGSDSISIFDPGSIDFPADVTIQGNVVVNAWKKWRGGGDNTWYDGFRPNVWGLRNCEGMFVVTPYELENDRKRTGKTGPVCDTVRIEGNIMARDFNPAKPFASIRGARNIEFVGNYLRGGAGLNNVDVDDLAGLPEWANAKRIYVEDQHADNVRLFKKLPNGQKLEIPFHCPGGSVLWEEGMTKAQVS